MNYSHIFAIVLRQYFLIKGSPARVLPLIIGVVIDIILWGYLEQYFSISLKPSDNFLPIMLSTILLFDFFSRVMHGVSMAFFEDVWSRNFLNFFATPITIAEYLMGLVFTGIITSVIGLGAMIIVSKLIFELSFAIYGFYIIPFYFILILFGLALGIIGCGIVLRFGPASEWLIWPIPAMLSPFAGAFYPLEILPVWLQNIGYIFPLWFIFEGMRSLARGEGVSIWGLFWTLCLTLVYMILALLFFKTIYRNAINSGLIAKYSAESPG